VHGRDVQRDHDGPLREPGRGDAGVAAARHWRRRQGSADADELDLTRIAVDVVPEDHGGRGVRLTQDCLKRARGPLGCGLFSIRPLSEVPLACPAGRIGGAQDYQAPARQNM
jgi:hypothetical protein